MTLSTKDIVLVDGTAQIQFKTMLKIVLMSVLRGQMSAILHSVHKNEDVLVISPQMDARMMIEITTTMRIASLRVILQ